MSDYESKRDEAAEAYATGNHRASFADSYDERAFKAGADWAREQFIYDLTKDNVKMVQLEQMDIPYLVEKVHSLTESLILAKKQRDEFEFALRTIEKMECPYGEGGCDSDDKRRVCWKVLD